MTASPVPVLIERDDDLACIAERLARAPRLALDCESNGMHAFRARLCVLQLACARPDAPADDIVLIDALSIRDFGPLASLLGPAGPVKIIHDVGFDARLLAMVDVTLGNVLDTAVFARFLRCRETGLASLLLARFGVTLDKTLQHHDWAKRPLGDAELRYLLGDVKDLGRLAASLEAEASALGIVDEVNDEIAYALSSALGAPDHVAAYARVRGARELGPVGRSVLRELIAVRDAAAEQWNLPPGRVASNASMLDLARARTLTEADVRKVGRLHGRGYELAARFVEAIARGVARGDVPFHERAWFAVERQPGDLGLRRVREALLTHWRTEESLRRGVDPQVVLPGHCLSDLAVTGARDLAALRAIAGFGEARLARYGEALIALLGTVA